MTSGLVTSVEQYRPVARGRSFATVCAVVVASTLVAFVVLAFPPGWYAIILVIGAATIIGTWYRPVVGVALTLGLTILFEQFDFAFFRPVTRVVPFFENISTFTPLAGMPASPLEVLLVTVVAVTLARIVVHREGLRQNPVAVPIALFGVCLVGWLAFGLLSGGSVNIALWELRGLAYFCLLAILVPQTIRHDSDVRLLIWAAIAGVTVKAAQGMWNYAVVLGGDLSEVISVTGHEDAVFIGWMLILMAGLLAYRSNIAQRNLLIAASPVMLMTFVATDRRAAYVALGLGLFVLGVLVATDPMKRHLLPRVGAPLLIALAIILAVGWNSSGPIGSPARAIKSIQAPETNEDIQSNYYRRAEEYTLIAAIRSSPILGLGFGRAFMTPGVLAKIDFSLADVIPHNEILWLWVKMGTIGFGMFWVMVGGLFSYGCVVFRAARRPYTRAVAALVTSAILMQLVVSYVDLQLTFARNMVFLGVLVGILARLSDLDGGDTSDVRL